MNALALRARRLWWRLADRTTGLGAGFWEHLHHVRTGREHTCGCPWQSLHS